MSSGLSDGILKGTVSDGITTTLKCTNLQGRDVSKWKKDAKEFSVSVRYNGGDGISTYLPKPVAEHLGNPETITYVIRKNRTEVKAGGSPE